MLRSHGLCNRRIDDLYNESEILGNEVKFAVAMTMISADNDQLAAARLSN